MTSALVDDGKASLLFGGDIAPVFSYAGSCIHTVKNNTGAMSPPNKSDASTTSTKADVVSLMTNTKQFYSTVTFILPSTWSVYSTS